jgi:hypothetical protein
MSSQTSGTVMIRTNLLVSIGLALVAKFADIVHIPAKGIPHTTNDLSGWMVGHPSMPTNLDLVLFQSKGVAYWVRDGGVDYFRTPGSLFYLQDAFNRPHAEWAQGFRRFYGTPTLTSNQVVRLATATLRRLTVHGDPLTSRPLVVQPAGMIGGHPLPYYTLTWVDTNHFSGYVAQVEVDARGGWITSMDLTATNFHDYALAARIAQRVYKKAPSRPRPAPQPRKRRWRCPSRTQVVQTLSAWLKVCRQMGVDPGNQTNVIDVDWEWSDYVTNWPTYLGRPVCDIALKNKSEIESMGGGVFIWTAWDQCYGEGWEDRDYPDWRPFVGKIAYRWQDLAKRFEDTLIEKCGFPATIRTQYQAIPGPWRQGNGRPPADPYKTIRMRGSADGKTWTGLPRIGDRVIARAIVGWYKLPLKYPVDLDQRLAWRVEFDLRTGEVKMFDFLGFGDLRVLDWFLRDQSRWK